MLNRLSTRARILSTDPPVERLDEAEPLTKFIVYLSTEGNVEELRSLADVEGVAQIHIESLAADSSPTSIAKVVDEIKTGPELISSSTVIPQSVPINPAPSSAPVPSTESYQCAPLKKHR